jgi:hypothetical protein
MLYWNRQPTASRPAVRHDRQRAWRAGGLLAAFVLGGVAGALGFKHLGFVCVVPLAAVLFVLALPPVTRDWGRWRGVLRRSR